MAAWLAPDKQFVVLTFCITGNASRTNVDVASIMSVWMYQVCEKDKNLLIVVFQCIQVFRSKRYLGHVVLHLLCTVLLDRRIFFHNLLSTSVVRMDVPFGTYQPKFLWEQRFGKRLSQTPSVAS